MVLAAGDTFRAAAADQLGLWAERVRAGFVRGNEGGDPGAVVFDAVQHASARDIPLVLADTAGRLHTKVNLMEELKKVRRVADRPPGSVTEVLLVIDATTGQNGLIQAKQFTEAVGVTGIVLTKLDGTAKGGIVVAIASELGIPIKLVGLGEGPRTWLPSTLRSLWTRYCRRIEPQTRPVVAGAGLQHGFWARSTHLVAPHGLFSHETQQGPASAPRYPVPGHPSQPRTTLRVQPRRSHHRGCPEARAITCGSTS